MGFPTKVQLIQRKDSQQWYITFPSAVAQAMEFQLGEIVEWIVVRWRDRGGDRFCQVNCGTERNKRRA